MKKNWLIGMLIIMAIIGSCKKEVEDEAGPEIVFSTPTDGQKFSLTDTVKIRARISHSEEMHTYVLLVENIDEGTTDTLINTHDHSKNISIDTWFFPNVTTHRHFRIRIVATDHQNKTSNKYVTIHVE